MEAVSFVPLMQQVIDILVLVLGTLASIGVAYGIKFIRSKITNDDFASSLALTLTTVGNSVRKGIQGMGEVTKKKVADGTLSPKDIADIQDYVKRDFLTQVSPVMQQRLGVHVGDIQKFIETTAAAELQKVDKVTG
jgi:hypothetical protein